MVNGKILNDIGGYLELDRYYQPIFHEKAKALNCGRNCLAYLLKAKKIKRIALPYFLCDSVREICIRENVDIRYYRIDKNLYPFNVEIKEDEWIYIVNYYGQISIDDIEKYRKKYRKIIVDNAQAYFDMPVKSVDTIYTCRKFFGVPDGAFLYTDSELSEELEQDESYQRMEFILGRYERPAHEFYELYAKNNDLFISEPIKEMSRLTKNLLHGISYEVVKEKRSFNYNFLFENLKDINSLKLKKVEGAFAYPLLLENGAEIRKKFIMERIYIPVLWPDVLQNLEYDTLEYIYADNILPLPCDQRYGEEEMQRICDLVRQSIYTND